MKKIFFLLVIAAISPLFIGCSDSIDTELPNKESSKVRVSSFAFFDNEIGRYVYDDSYAKTRGEIINVAEKEAIERENRILDSLALFAKENNLKFSVKYVNMQNASEEHPRFNSADDSIGTSDPFFPDDPSDSSVVGGSYSVVNATLLDGQQYPPLSLSYNDYTQNYFSASLSATFTYSSSGFIYAIFQTVVYHNVSCRTPSSFVVLSGITDHSPENIQNQQTAFSEMNCFERVDEVELYYSSSELQKQNIKWQCNFLLYYFVEDSQYDTI